MRQLAEADEKVDVVFMDPPRNGSTEEFMDSVLQLHPARLIYISCNPETLARDLQYLTGRHSEDKRSNKGAAGVKEQRRQDRSLREKAGRGKYVVEEITPVDMFPFTANVEVVVKLQYNPPKAGMGKGKNQP